MSHSVELSVPPLQAVYVVLVDRLVRAELFISDLLLALGLFGQLESQRKYKVTCAVLNRRQEVTQQYIEGEVQKFVERLVEGHVLADQI